MNKAKLAQRLFFILILLLLLSSVNDRMRGRETELLQGLLHSMEKALAVACAKYTSW